jgi:hypothetical protein
MFSGNSPHYYWTTAPYHPQYFGLTGGSRYDQGAKGKNWSGGKSSLNQFSKSCVSGSGKGFGESINKGR